VTILLLNYEILDLGLVLYRDVIKDPYKIINDVNSLDKRYNDGEHGSSFTEVKPWLAWQNESAGTMETFCWQKFFPPEHAISPSDYYFDEQLSISKRLYETLCKYTLPILW
jgi:hypothetical protein